MENNYYPYINLPLPYDYNAMEPFIDTRTMQLHHDRHLQIYIDNWFHIINWEKAEQNYTQINIPL